VWLVEKNVTKFDTMDNPNAWRESALFSEHLEMILHLIDPSSPGMWERLYRQVSFNSEETLCLFDRVKCFFTLMHPALRGIALFSKQLKPVSIAHQR
jgi:hypothetical protein